MALMKNTLPDCDDSINKHVCYSILDLLYT